MFDAPDIIERMFNIPQYFNHRPKQKGNTYPGNNAPFRVIKKRMGKTNNINNNLILDREFV